MCKLINDLLLHGSPFTCYLIVYSSQTFLWKPLSSEGCLMKWNEKGKKGFKENEPCLDIYSVWFQVSGMTVTRYPCSLPRPIFSTISREQDLICRFISHFTWRILQRARPATHHRRPATEMLCKWSSGLWKVERRGSIFWAEPTSTPKHRFSF